MHFHNIVLFGLQLQYTKYIRFAVSDCARTGKLWRLWRNYEENYEDFSQVWLHLRTVHVAAESCNTKLNNFVFVTLSNLPCKFGYFWRKFTFLRIFLELLDAHNSKLRYDIFSTSLVSAKYAASLPHYAEVQVTVNYGKIQNRR